MSLEIDATSWGFVCGQRRRIGSDPAHLTPLIGAPCVWAIDHTTKTVTVFRPGRDPGIVRRAGRVDAAPALPAFALEVETLFAGL